MPRPAIYLDFEGRADHAPILLGHLAAGPGDEATIKQVVLDGRFAPAAAASDLEVVDVELIIDRLVLRAESEDRPLIGWSTHEIDVVERLLRTRSRPVASASATSMRR